MAAENNEAAAMGTPSPRGELLRVRNLRTTFHSHRRLIKAVRGMDLTVGDGEFLAIVGESGSGKSVAMKSIMDLLPKNAEVTADKLEFAGKNMLAMSAKERRAAWREIEKKYMPWRDYDGNAFLENGGFWMQKQHIFLYPFYYIDYALAQICTFSLYDEMKHDRESAWARYLKLCRAGGTMGYFDLLHSVGIPVPFEDGAVEKAVRGVIEEIESAKY